MKYTLMNKHMPIVELSIDEETASIVKVEQLLNPDYLPVGIQITRGIPDRAGAVRIPADKADSRIRTSCTTIEIFGQR